MRHVITLVVLLWAGTGPGDERRPAPGRRGRSDSGARCPVFPRQDRHHWRSRRWVRRRLVRTRGCRTRRGTNLRGRLLRWKWGKAGISAGGRRPLGPLGIVPGADPQAPEHRFDATVELVLV